MKNVIAAIILIFACHIAWATSPAGHSINDSKKGTAQSVLAQGPKDAEMGCCVFETNPPKCVITNRAYCRTRAKQAKINYSFHPNVNCNAVPACKK